MANETDWSAFEDSIISTQADMTLPEIQQMTGADTLAQAVARLIRSSRARD